jgi:hypothetical protein
LPDVEFFELLQGLASDRPTHAGGSIESLVMKHFDRLLERQAGILGEMSRGAAMRYFYETGHDGSRLDTASGLTNFEDIIAALTAS